jgi:hypothetical protein
MHSYYVDAVVTTERKDKQKYSMDRSRWVSSKQRQEHQPELQRSCAPYASAEIWCAVDSLPILELRISIEGLPIPPYRSLLSFAQSSAYHPSMLPPSLNFRINTQYRALAVLITAVYHSTLCSLLSSSYSPSISLLHPSLLSSILLSTLNILPLQNAPKNPGN